ncbi:tol-pal system protein YbgF [Maridesulfovibrio bastinii]|uniref:tol-pal system protein YbgF n=1 Tax=Maridesulfovibrio bastinii TaxID=47157 RepID=UPI000413E104|nr:tol-pal system protein YbgF [Maridesulfovibrio bastinii]
MKYARILLFLILAFSSTACSLTKQQDKPAWGGSEEWRMKSLEESFLNFKEGMSQQKDALKKLNENMDKRFDSIDERLDGFEDRLAEMDKQQKELMEAQKSSSTPEVVMGGSASNEDRPWMNVPGEGNETADSQVAAAPVSTKSEVKTPVVEEAPKTAPKAVSKPAPKAPAVNKAEAVYKEGVRLVLNGKPDESRTVLTKFLQTYPTNDLAPNALYWLGETFYSQKRYAESILRFREVGQRFPKADKVPDSLLKIGLAYDKLGDKQNALFYINTLIGDYPNSAPAKIGRSRLKEIGG